MSEDDWRWHMYDTVKGSEWLGDQDAIHYMCRYYNCHHLYDVITVETTIITVIIMYKIIIIIISSSWLSSSSSSLLLFSSLSFSSLSFLEKRHAPYLNLSRTECRFPVLKMERFIREHLGDSLWIMEKVRSSSSSSSSVSHPQSQSITHLHSTAELLYSSDDFSACITSTVTLYHSYRLDSAYIYSWWFYHLYLIGGQAYRCAAAADRTGHAMLHTLYGRSVSHPNSHNIIFLYFTWPIS